MSSFMFFVNTYSYNTQSRGNEKLVGRLGRTYASEYLYLYLRKGVVGSEYKTPI